MGCQRQLELQFQLTNNVSRGGLLQMFMNWERRICRLLLLAVVLITSSPSFTHGQGIGAVGGQIVSGEVASITNHSMELKLYD